MARNKDTDVNTATCAFFFFLAYLPHEAHLVTVYLALVLGCLHSSSICTHS